MMGMNGKPHPPQLLTAAVYVVPHGVEGREPISDVEQEKPSMCYPLPRLTD